jgi:hypothetical protein
MRKKLGVIAMLLALATASFAVQSKPPATECVLSDEDYKVFSAVIDGLGNPEDPEEAWKNKEILVSDATADPGTTESKWGPWGFRSNSNAAPAKETEAAFKSRAHDLVISKPGFTLQSLISSSTTASWKTCSRRVAVGGTSFIRSILAPPVFGIFHIPATTRPGLKQCFMLDIRAAVYVVLVISSSSPKRTVNGK